MTNPVTMALDIIDGMEADAEQLTARAELAEENAAIACALYAAEVKRADRWRAWAFAFCTAGMAGTFLSPIFVLLVWRWLWT